MTVTLGQNLRDTVLDALVVYLTAGLVDVYGDGRLASRDPNDLNDDKQGEECPRIFIMEETRTRPDDMMIPLAELEITMFGLFRRIGYSEPLIQTQLNKLEYFIDYMIARISTLGVYTDGRAISASVIQKPGQMSYGKAGNDEGWLEYHATVVYPVALS